ncbi:unnamed protein product, partial [Medioppia subpectinata]
MTFPEESHEKCVPKSEASDIYLSCGTNERIAIYEAFFTTSARHRCSQSYTVITESTTQISEEEDNNNKYAFPRLPSACTDDIRLSLNRRLYQIVWERGVVWVVYRLGCAYNQHILHVCSSAPNCSFNFIKHHNHGCIGEDGSVIIRYTCISENKFHPFCNLNLSDSYGYVSTPGYPRFYPPYESCVWNIKGSEGQVIQIDILDVAIKEPDSKYSVGNRKKVHYQCTDSLTLRESKSQTLTLCGEVKSNLLQYRTKSNALTIEFTAFEFSPTRGILFRYSYTRKNKFHPFCNLNLSDSYGYVSTPGYPRFYPPYESCVWNIKGSEGQVIQIDILDVAIKEPDSKYSVGNRKKVHYQCTDSLTLRESKSQTLTLCGEVKSNLLQYRTKSNALTIEFTAFEFSPTRGILFRYSSWIEQIQNCPTLPAPKNGHLITRNGSFAYYSCCMDYVFEDTKQTDKVLYCQYGNHWNSSLSKCV